MTQPVEEGGGGRAREGGEKGAAGERQGGSAGRGAVPQDFKGCGGGGGEGDGEGRGGGLCSTT